MTVEDDEPIPLVEAEPAFLLEEGIAYVRGWTMAQHSAMALKDALAGLGQENAMPYLRADVNVFGAGIVELGRVTPETADLIARALRMMTSAAGKRDGCAA